MLIKVVIGRSLTLKMNKKKREREGKAALSLLRNTRCPIPDKANKTYPCLLVWSDLGTQATFSLTKTCVFFIRVDASMA